MCAFGSLVFAFLLSADRVHALAYPMKYKIVDHKRRQVIALILGLILGIGTSLYDCFRFVVIERFRGSYELVVDDVYVKGALAIKLSLTQLRNIVRFAFLVLLMISNVALIILYRYRSRKMRKMREGNSSKLSVLRASEKTLLVLSVSESVSKTFSNSCWFTTYVMYAVAPSFYTCGQTVIGSLLNIVLAVFPAIDFCVSLSVSKPYRSLVIKALPHWGKICGDESMSPVESLI